MALSSLGVLSLQSYEVGKLSEGILEGVPGEVIGIANFPFSIRFNAGGSVSMGPECAF